MERTRSWGGKWVSCTHINAHKHTLIEQFGWVAAVLSAAWEAGKQEPGCWLCNTGFPWNAGSNSSWINRPFPHLTHGIVLLSMRYSFHYQTHCAEKCAIRTFIRAFSSSQFEQLSCFWNKYWVKIASSNAHLSLIVFLCHAWLLISVCYYQGLVWSTPTVQRRTIGRLSPVKWLWNTTLLLTLAKSKIQSTHAAHIVINAQKELLINCRRHVLQVVLSRRWW